MTQQWVRDNCHTLVQVSHVNAIAQQYVREICHTYIYAGSSCEWAMTQQCVRDNCHTLVQVPPVIEQKPSSILETIAIPWYRFLL
jgi:hypothetical protein